MFSYISTMNNTQHTITMKTENMYSHITRRFGSDVVDQLNNESFRSTGCCVIWSVAAVTGIEPRVVFDRAVADGAHFTNETARIAKENNRSVWGGTTTNRATLRAMCGPEFDVEQLYHLGRGITITELLKRIAGEPGKYIVRVRGHVFAIDNDTMIEHEWLVGKRRRMVCDVWRVTPAA